MKKVILFLCIVCQYAFVTGQGIPGKSKTTLTVMQWQEDLDFLQSEILKVHPDPFFRNKDLDRKKYDRLFTELKNNVNTWSENKIITEITRIMGLMNDGHSSVDVFADSRSFYGFTYFPLVLYYFTEGIYVTGAAEQHKNTIGKRLIAINDRPIEEVISLMRPLISKDFGNDASMKDGLRFFLITSQFLNGLGITQKQDEAVYSFIDDRGNKTEVKLIAGSRQDYFSAFDRSGNEGKPLYRQDPMKYYWFRYLADKEVLYIKYTFEQIDNNLTPAIFCRQMQEIIDNYPLKKVVLDLRQNQGGNIGTLKPLYEFLIQPKINQRGKLYVITDRRTQSAGTVIAIRLGMISKAISVGEPAVTAVNFFDNNRTVVLPNSKLKTGISSHFLYAGFPVDNRSEYTADIHMEMTAKDYFSMKDPIFDYVMQHKIEETSYPSGITPDPNIAGIYKYSNFQVIEIAKNRNDWKMRIPDGNNIELLNTTMYPVGINIFQTDVKDLKVKVKDKELIFETPWGKMNFSKLPEGYEPPALLIEKGKIDEAIAGIRKQYKNSSTIDLKELEAAINSWGYLLLNKKDTPNAIKIFKLNTEMFASSANTWDSLGEAYAIVGNKDEAIRCYKKALEISPGLASALQALKTLQ